MSSVVWVSEWRAEVRTEGASGGDDGKWVPVAEGPLFVCQRDEAPRFIMIVRSRSQNTGAKPWRPSLCIVVRPESERSLMHPLQRALSSPRAANVARHCAGAQRYVVSDDFEYTNAKPHIHFAEHAKGAIYNLTFSTQQEGAAQFDQACRILDAIKVGLAASLTPLATLPEVRPLHRSLPHARELCGSKFFTVCTSVRRQHTPSRTCRLHSTRQQPPLRPPPSRVPTARTPAR